jgi:putative transposase
MTNIRRYFRPDEVVFLTHVTYKRIPILINNFEILWESISNYKNQIGFDMITWVVLPDHFHMLIHADNIDISNLMKKIKLSFSTKLRKLTNQQKGRVWQYRFWDHLIRSQVDLNRHIDYIHFNPAKHGYVNKPFDWRYSSIREYIERGIYPEDCGIVDPDDFKGGFGE